jgi:hypothetical protein
MNANNLIDEIKKSGFLLEWKVAKIFEETGFSVDQNLLLNPFILSKSFSDRLIEVDVLAIESRIGGPADGYVVECKGAASSDKLVLIPTPKDLHSLPSIYFDSGAVKLDGNRNIFCVNSSPDSPSFCHTGDFFTGKEGGPFQKAAKQDEKNNLYKGISQLHLAIDAVFLNYPKSSFRVFPVIVTNAEIHVVTFDLALSTDEQVKTRVVPWAAYQNPMFYDESTTQIGRNDWTVINGGASDALYADRHRIPAVWIVNVAYLKEFITDPGKLCRGVIKSPKTGGSSCL